MAEHDIQVRPRTDVPPGSDDQNWTIVDLLERREALRQEPSLGRRLWGMAAKVLAFALPWFAVPRPCPRCWARLELSNDQLVGWEETDFVRGVRYWLCPECNSSLVQRYGYSRNDDSWPVY